MPSRTERTHAARPEAASSFSDDSEFDRLSSDSRAVARATEANRTGQQSSRTRIVDPTTCEQDYVAAELEFMQAMQEYKRQSGRMFPTWSEVLEVLHSLGYEKSAGAQVAQ